MENALSFRQWLEESAGPTQTLADVMIGVAKRVAGAAANRPSTRPGEFSTFDQVDPPTWHDRDREPNVTDAFADWGEAGREVVSRYMTKVNADLVAKDSLLSRIAKLSKTQVSGGLSHATTWAYESVISPDIYLKLFSTTKAWVEAWVRASKTRRAPYESGGIMPPGRRRRQLRRSSNDVAVKAREMLSAWKDILRFKVYGILQGHLMWYAMLAVWLSGRAVSDYEFTFLGWKVGVYLLIVLQGILLAAGAAFPSVAKLASGVNKILSDVKPEAFKDTHSRVNNGSRSDHR